MPRVVRQVGRLARDQPRRVDLVERVPELDEPLQVGDRAVAALGAVEHERRAGDAAEHHVVAAEHDVAGRVAGVHRELARRLRDLLEQEVGVESHDAVVRHVLARVAQPLLRLRQVEADADLRHQPAPAALEGVHRLVGQDVVAGHAIHEHRCIMRTHVAQCQRDPGRRPSAAPAGADRRGARRRSPAPSCRPPPASTARPPGACWRRSRRTISSSAIPTRVATASGSARCAWGPSPRAPPSRAARGRSSSASRRTRARRPRSRSAAPRRCS